MTSAWAAPGRVNLIGEHVDYNEGVVLPFALQFLTITRATARGRDTVCASSEGVGSAEFPVDARPGDVDGWGAYVAGVVWALRQRGGDLPGLDLAITSDVPLGAGLSSSAALTCSVTAAISDECDLGLTREQAAEVSRAAENDFVGVPTGAMDQLASLLCEADFAMLLDCRSMQTRQIRFDPAGAGLTLMLIDTAARHSLVGSEYADRRRDCEEAAARLAVPSLRDATLSQVAKLPTDRLRRRARHVVTEIQRVADVAAVLQAGHPADIGASLTASHESLRDDFAVSCEELDVTVDAAVSAGALGARMVGAGFGGCVIALCRSANEQSVLRAVRAAYDVHNWRLPRVSGARPSPGAHRVS